MPSSSLFCRAFPARGACLSWVLSSCSAPLCSGFPAAFQPQIPLPPGRCSCPPRTWPRDLEGAAQGHCCNLFYYHLLFISPVSLACIFSFLVSFPWNDVLKIHRVGCCCSLPLFWLQFPAPWLYHNVFIHFTINWCLVFPSWHITPNAPSLHTSCGAQVCAFPWAVLLGCGIFESEQMHVSNLPRYWQVVLEIECGNSHTQLQFTVFCAV